MEYMELRSRWSSYERYRLLEEHESGGVGSRPSLGFPLGTALLLIVLFSLSGVFSCCYHWNKLRSLRRSHHPFDDSSSPTKPMPMTSGKQEMKAETVTVIMAGDEIAKFIGLPCPCQPPRPSCPPPSLAYPPPPAPAPFPLQYV